VGVEALRAVLPEVPGASVRLHESMRRHTPLRVGGAAQIWLRVDDETALKKSLGLIRGEKVRWRTAWPFQDLLVRDGVFQGVQVRPGRAWEGLEQLDGGHVRLGAATPWAALRRLGPTGWWSDLATWPGCPGGTWDDHTRLLLRGRCPRIRVFKGRGSTEHPIEDEPPALKPSTVLHWVELAPGRHLRSRPRRSRPHPLGSLFADVNGRPAAEVLQRAQLIGTRLRNWRLSETEPGTVIQLGGGSCHDLQLLVRGVQARADRLRGADLSVRIPFVGDDR